MKALAIILALLDLAPIFFLSLGLFFLVQLADRLDPRSRRMALAGLALVVLGGLAGAASNLSLAIFEEDIPLLAATSHVFGAPGSALMAAAVIRALRNADGPRVAGDPWVAPMLVSWLFLIAAFYLNATFGGDLWSRVLLLLSVLAEIALCIAACLLGWRRQLHMAAALFALNAAAAVVGAAVSVFTSQTMWIHLFVFLVNLAARSAFVFASWRIAAEYGARVGPTAPV
ncbi:MAG: hypothetical protein K1Y01_01835 [Vicinamibacteria bacterium]|nr:hypothetical protein [Vicinamibacteria bacterium]